MKRIKHDLVGVFYSKSVLGTDDCEVVLSPQLSHYKGVLSYDDRGNANISVIRKSDGKYVFDMSLDNGEINVMEEL